MSVVLQARVCVLEQSPKNTG